MSTVAEVNFQLSRYSYYCRYCLFLLLPMPLVDTSITTDFSISGCDIFYSVVAVITIAVEQGRILDYIKVARKWVGAEIKQANKVAEVQ